jgi:pimeloyl-ACP methyl ester carboxylesterase
MLSWNADLIAALVERGFTVVRFDNRDVGLSTHLTEKKPPNAFKVLFSRKAAPYRLADMADDAFAVMDDVGWEKAHVAGMSMGAGIAQTMAIAHPERVLTLTSIGFTPSPRQGRMSVKAGRAVMKAARVKPTNRTQHEDAAVSMYRVIGSPGYPADEKALRQVAGDEYDRAYDPDGVRRQAAAIAASGSRTKALRNLNLPTLVIHGEADLMVPVKAGRATAAAIPGARLITFPGMGHDLPRQLWPAMADAIADLAQQVSNI